MRMNKNIAIVTWIYYQNFGTHLQAYALQQMIRSLGYNNSIISDERIVKKKREVSFLRKHLISLYTFLRTTPTLRKGKKTSSDCYHKFDEQYLSIDNEWKDYAELNSKYDVFVCGSDQIWSPLITLNPHYFAGFTNKKKVAYAPSLGRGDCSEDWANQVKPLIEAFEHVSVREKDGAELLKTFISNQVEVVLDPTLLLPSSEWDKLTEKKYQGKPYVLCYLLTYNETYLNFVREFANRKNLSLKIFVIDKRVLSCADVPLFVGPQEFINEIKHSTFFFTDSFHGSIFAIHFEKTFYTFKRFADDSPRSQNSRLQNLFEKLNLTPYFIGEESIQMLENLPAIDYKAVKELLDKERLVSLEYLTNVLAD